MALSIKTLDGCVSTDRIGYITESPRGATRAWRNSFVFQPFSQRSFMNYVTNRRKDEITAQRLRIGSRCNTQTVHET